MNFLWFTEVGWKFGELEAERTIYVNASTIRYFVKKQFETALLDENGNYIIKDLKRQMRSVEYTSIVFSAAGEETDSILVKESCDHILQHLPSN